MCLWSQVCCNTDVTDLTEAIVHTHKWNPSESLVDLIDLFLFVWNSFFSSSPPSRLWRASCTHCMSLSLSSSLLPSLPSSLPHSLPPFLLHCITLSNPPIPMILLILWFTDMTLERGKYKPGSHILLFTLFSLARSFFLFTPLLPLSSRSLVLLASSFPTLPLPCVEGRMIK